MPPCSATCCVTTATVQHILLPYEQSPAALSEQTPDKLLALLLRAQMETMRQRETTLAPLSCNSCSAGINNCVSK